MVVQLRWQQNGDFCHAIPRLRCGSSKHGPFQWVASYILREGVICALNDIAGNHTGYKQFKGTRATAEDISQLYQGLCQSYLTDFDVMLSGYTPNAPAVEVVGNIGLDLQEKARERPGSFFWGTVFLPFLSGCLDGY